MTWTEAIIAFLVWVVGMIICLTLFIALPLSILAYFGLAAYATHYLVALSVVLVFVFIAVLKYTGGRQ